MDSLAQLKEPITRTYTHFEIFYALLGRATGSDTAKRKLDYAIRPYFEQDGKKYFSPDMITGTIADINVEIADNPNLESLRQKALNADGLLNAGIIEVHGWVGT